MLPIRPYLTYLVSLLSLAGGGPIGCATTDSLTDPPLDVALEVSNVDQRQRNLIEKHVCSFDGVTGCQFEIGATLAPALQAKNDADKSEGAEAASSKADAKAGAKEAAQPKGTKTRRKQKKADAPTTQTEKTTATDDDASVATAIDPDLQKVTGVLVFRYTGRVDQLRYHIGQLQHPGLKPKIARTALSFDGFDNTSPTLTIIKPTNGLVVTTGAVEVEVDVPDFDIKTVIVNTTQAAFAPSGHYHATLPLDDGPHTISVAALDESGNETAQSITITVDTTPPALTVKVTKVSDTKMNLRGSPGDATRLTLDGKPLKFGDFYQKLVDIDPDKKTAKLVATDAHGNEATLVVPLKDGTTLPAP